MFTEQYNSCFLQVSNQNNGMKEAIVHIISFIYSWMYACNHCIRMLQAWLDYYLGRRVCPMQLMAYLMYDQ